MSIYPNFPKRITHFFSQILTNSYELSSLQCFPNTSNFSPTPNLTSPYPRSANSFRLKSKIARKSRSTFRLIDLGVRRSRVLGSDQSGLVAVPQGQTSIAGEPGTVQAPLRPEPATPSRGQAQGRWCASQHRPQCSFRRGQ